MLFDSSKHGEDDPNKFTANNRQMINIVEYRCRMKFGTANKYDPTGEGNLTEGILPQTKGTFICDGNQHPIYTDRRNHPISIQISSCNLYYGKNSDIQRLLISNLGEHIIKALGKNYFPKFFFNLDLSKCK